MSSSRRAFLSLVVTLAGAMLLRAQTGDGGRKKPLPRFEDYPVVETWKGPAAPLRLLSRSERMFQTRFSEGVKDIPNFAGHYLYTDWGCGTRCIAGGLLDLKTGRIFPLPFTKNVGSWGDWIICVSVADFGNALETRIDSRLMIVRCGLGCDDEAEFTPNTYYLLWERDHFRRLAYVRGRGKHWC